MAPSCRHALLQEEDTWYLSPSSLQCLWIQHTKQFNILLYYYDFKANHQLEKVSSDTESFVFKVSLLFYVYFDMLINLLRRNIQSNNIQYITRSRQTQCSTQYIVTIKYRISFNNWCPWGCYLVSGVGVADREFSDWDWCYKWSWQLPCVKGASSSYQIKRRNVGKLAVILPALP